MEQCCYTVLSPTRWGLTGITYPSGTDSGFGRRDYTCFTSFHAAPLSAQAKVHEPALCPIGAIQGEYGMASLRNSIKYIGRDVHKESISIAVMNAAGKIVMEYVIETKASTTLQFIGRAARRFARRV
jgi:hypothetical protein